MIVVQKVMMVIPLSHGSFFCSKRLSNRFQFTLKCDLIGWLSLASSFVEIRINKQIQRDGRTLQSKPPTDDLLGLAGRVDAIWCPGPLWHRML